MNKCKSFFLSIWPLKTIEDCKAKSYFCFDRFLRRQSFSCIDNWVTELLHILFFSGTKRDIGLTFAVKSHAVWLHWIFEIFVPFYQIQMLCVLSYSLTFLGSALSSTKRCKLQEWKDRCFRFQVFRNYAFRNPPKVISQRVDRCKAEFNPTCTIP